MSDFQKEMNRAVDAFVAQITDLAQRAPRVPSGISPKRKCARGLQYVDDKRFFDRPSRACASEGGRRRRSAARRGPGPALAIGNRSAPAGWAVAAAAHRVSKFGTQNARSFPTTIERPQAVAHLCNGEPDTAGSGRR